MAQVEKISGESPFDTPLCPLAGPFQTTKLEFPLFVSLLTLTPNCGVSWALPNILSHSPGEQVLRGQSFLSPGPSFLWQSLSNPHPSGALDFHSSPNPKQNQIPNHRCRLRLSPDEKCLREEFFPSSYSSLVALGSSTPNTSLGVMTLLLLIQSLTPTPILSLGWALAQGTQPWPRWAISQGKLCLQTTHPFPGYLLTLPRMVIVGSGNCCCCSLLQDK